MKNDHFRGLRDPLSDQPAHSVSKDVKALVETALREVVSARGTQSRQSWVEHLTAAMMSPVEAEHAKVLGALVSNGVTREELLHDYVPQVAQHIGELWVQDRANFVDVSVATARLQNLFRESDRSVATVWQDRTIPLTQSVLLIVPDFEEHSIGAFVAADQFRRHGLCTNLALGLSTDELIDTLRNKRFGMIGLTLATWKSVLMAEDLIDALRAAGCVSAPIAIGGRVTQEYTGIRTQTGADIVVRSVREVVEKLGLASVAEPLDSGALL